VIWNYSNFLDYTASNLVVALAIAQQAT